jgi:putative hydrolase of the HAD superfamily
MSILLFDLFGVIARQQSEQGRAGIEQAAGVSGAHFWNSYWSLRPPYDRGHQTGPEYWHAVAEDVDASFTDQRITDLVAADVRSWSEVDDEMVTFVCNLAEEGVRLGLFSNIPAELVTDYEQRHPWLDVFSVRAFSCRIGRAKPEIGAYAWCTTAFEAPASDVLFIDDRMENVKAAEIAGMRSHLFTSLDTLRTALIGCCREGLLR